MKPIYPYQFNLNLKDGTIKAITVHGTDEKDAYENARWMHKAEGNVIPPLPKVKK